MSPASPLPAAIDTVEIETGPSPTHAVIWLHGLGADGHDFEPVVGAMDLASLPPTRFVFPHAPMRPVTINGGYVMRAWYDIVSADFSQRREDPQGVRESAGMAEALLARELARGVAAEHVVLAGFSQGGAIALHAGLRHSRRLAGILALSTYLPLVDTVAAERHPANAQTPVFMAHGRDDEVIPYSFAKLSYGLLSQLSQPISWHSYFTGHTVCLDELRDIAQWLTEVLGGGSNH